MGLNLKFSRHCTFPESSTCKRKIPEAEKKCLSVDLVDKVNVISGGVQDVANQVAFDRVPRARSLVVRNDALVN